MSTFTDRRKFREKNPEKLGSIPAQMGDGYGHLAYPGYPGYFYCRVAGRIEIVYNDRVPAQNDLLVDVGRDTVTGSETPGIFKVLSTRTASPAGAGSQVQAGYAPAKRYEWMALGGGQDPLWVHQRQIMPLRTGAHLGMLVQLWPGLLWNGTENKSIAFQTIDLSTHIPTTPGEAAFVLITIDIDGVVVDTKGDEFTLEDMTTAALMLANIPEAPADTAYISAAVRVYESQTAVRENRTNTDVIDLRHMNGGNVVPADHEGLTGLLGGTTDEHYHLTEAEYLDLLGDLDGGNSIEHFHESDRDRSNHTGTQTAATISDFAATVRATILTGLSLSSSQVIAATDTILQAFGYIQAQITNLLSYVSNQWIPVTGSWTIISQAYTNDPAAGVDIVLNMAATANFAVGDHVTVISSAGIENARVKAVVLNTSITVASLALNHTTTDRLVVALKFTVPTDATATYQKGMKIRFKQGGAYKYATAKSIAATLITLVSTLDTQIENASVTDIWYSFGDAPFGWPDWFSFDMPWTAVTTDPVIGNGSILAYYRPQGTKGMFQKSLVTMGSTTTYGSGSYNFGLVVPSSNAPGNVALESAAGNLLDSSVALRYALAAFVRVNDMRGLYQNQTLSPTAPITFADGDKINLSAYWEW